MFPDRVLVVAQQVGNISYRHAALQKDTRERMAEAMRSRFLFELPGKFKNPVEAAPPGVRDRE